MPGSLNLSNEVVKMRAEVKRVRVLVIRRLTRQIAALKKKKGKEIDLERNQRRAARLLEEIKEMKVLAPDSITKAALQKDISFEKVCQNKESSLSERATVRIATHPEFNKKIQDIKKAIEAFKAERKSAAKAEKKTQKELRDIVQEQDRDDEEGAQESDDEEDGEASEHEGDDGPSQMIQKADTEGKQETEKQDKDAPTAAKAKSSETASTPAEVVRMRKEVKKLRMLIIRKLTRQIGDLKKMKGEESDLKMNQEGAARLQKEVQVLRGLLPDHVTNTALQGNINVDEVLQDPESGPLERATARIVTHPRFIKKFQAVRDAIEEERAKAAKAEEKQKSKAEPSNESMDEDSDGEGDESENDYEEEEEEEEAKDEDEKASEHSSDDTPMKDKKKGSKEQTLKVIKTPDGHQLDNTQSNVVLLSVKEKTLSVKPKGGVTDQAEKTATNQITHVVKTPAPTAVVHSSPAKSKETPVKKVPPASKDPKPETIKPETESLEEESDLESSDGEEEKEYFDDSTEERFHKQSSLSDDSDEDDFFLGKVSKLKKKKSSASGKGKNSEPKLTVEEQSTKEVSDTSQRFKMESVFCSTLSKPTGPHQKGKPHGPKPPHFQNQKKRPDGDAKQSWFKSQGADTNRKPRELKGPGSRQMGTAGGGVSKPAFEWQHNQSKKGAPGKFFKPPQHSQQAIHPSWEASRKRKEQQSQITAFQGKKIKFDDDD